jgi:hypothetical protein
MMHARRAQGAIAKRYCATTAIRDGGYRAVAPYPTDSRRPDHENRCGITFGLVVASQAHAQTAPAAQPLPRGTATDVSNGEILATVQTTAAAPVSDQQLRVVSINGEYNDGAGVVHRAKTQGRDIGFGIEHSQITEIYHVISGNATLVTGGTIENMEGDAGQQPSRHDAQRAKLRRRQGHRWTGT